MYRGNFISLFDNNTIYQFKNKVNLTLNFVYSLKYTNQLALPTKTPKQKQFEITCYHQLQTMHHRTNRLYREKSAKTETQILLFASLSWIFYARRRRL